jgi:hypothetical protein
MKHEVATLEGALLNDAVAMAEGWRKVSATDEQWACKTTSGWLLAGQMMRCAVCQPLEFSDWEHCGQIIERERITVAARGGFWRAHVPGTAAKLASEADAATPLIAAMRAYVASRFGAEVDLP